jgi:hypothetical protein
MSDIGAKAIDGGDTKTSLCEGCFCNSTTRRAEGDHYMGLNLNKGG